MLFNMVFYETILGKMNY